MRLITRNHTEEEPPVSMEKLDTFPHQLCECRRDGEICNNLQVCPEDEVVSFFLQQSVLLAERVEFLPGLSWRLLTDCAKTKNSGFCKSAQERAETGGGRSPWPPAAAPP